MLGHIRRRAMWNHLLVRKARKRQQGEDVARRDCSKSFIWRRADSRGRLPGGAPWICSASWWSACCCIALPSTDGDASRKYGGMAPGRLVIYSALASWQPARQRFVSVLGGGSAQPQGMSALMPAKPWKRVSSHAPPPQTRQRQRRAGPARRWLVDNPRLLRSCWLRIVEWLFDDRGKDQIILGAAWVLK